MNLLGLKYFIAVSEFKSFTKASEYLYVSQPTLSRQIAELEEELGRKLLDRQSRSISLTKAGEICFREAKEIVERCDALSEVVKSETPEDEGVLKIGYMGMIEHGLMSVPIRKFAEKYPRVKTFLYKNSLSELNHLLLQDKCDVIYTVKAGIDTIKQIDCTVLVPNELKLMVPVTHPLAGRNFVKLEELPDEKFVMLKRDSSPYLVDHLFSMCMRKGFSPKVVYYVEDPQTVLYAVALGKGIAFLSERINPDNVNGVKTIDIVDCDMDCSMVLAYKREKNNEYVSSFIGEVKKHLGI